MPSFPVSEPKLRQLLEAMRRLAVNESDFEEHFVRSAGAGGQHVNKTSTCVVLVHRPTGLRVRCQRERSQAMNRFLARRLLLEKIAEQVEGRRSAARQQREKIRRQKRRRSRRSKQRMLEGKRRRAVLKESRRKPEPAE